MKNTLHRYGPMVGRILIAFIFVFSGIGKLTGFEGKVGYIASKGLPLPFVLGSILHGAAPKTKTTKAEQEWPRRSVGHC